MFIVYIINKNSFSFHFEAGFCILWQSPQVPGTRADWDWGLTIIVQDLKQKKYSCHIDNKKKPFMK